MKHLLKLAFIITAYIFCNMGFAAESPLGYWKTIDDVTHKPQSILEFYKEADGKIYGKVVKIFPSKGHDVNEVCTACTDARHNQRIVGMIVLEGLNPNKSNPTEWNGGTILDPKNGKVYNATIRLVDSGQKLNLRGYIGIPLLGRTQTWLRVDNIEQA